MFSTLVKSSVRMSIATTRAFSAGGRLSGTVKWFDTKKGFGFINGGNEADIFVHQSQIQSDGFRSLVDGENVEFEIVFDESRGNKKSAIKVTGPGGNILASTRIPRRDFNQQRDFSV